MTNRGKHAKHEEGGGNATGAEAVQASHASRKSRAIPDGMLVTDYFSKSANTRDFFLCRHEAARGKGGGTAAITSHLPR